jgi:hypothetical protein
MYVTAAAPGPERLAPGAVELPKALDLRRCRARVGRGGRYILDRCNFLTYEEFDPEVWWGSIGLVCMQLPCLGGARNLRGSRLIGCFWAPMPMPVQASRTGPRRCRYTEEACWVALRVSGWIGPVSSCCVRAGARLRILPRCDGGGIPCGSGHRAARTKAMWENAKP